MVFLKKVLFPKLFSSFSDDAVGTIEEEFKKAEEEIKDEEEGTPSEETPASEKEPAKEEGNEKEPSEEDAKLEDLENDDDFKAEKAELEKEKGGKLSIGEFKRFKKVYWKAKEGERSLNDLKTQLEELQNKSLSDDEVIAEAVKRKLLPTQEKKPEKKEEPEEKFDVDKFLNGIEDLEERENVRKWVGVIKKLAKEETKTIENTLAQYQERFGALDAKDQRAEVNREYEQVQGYVKDKFKLDFEKDLLPEVQKLMAEKSKRLPEGVSLLDAGWTPMTLTKQVLADKGFDLAKKTFVAEQEELKKTKKKAQVETETEPEVPGDDSNKGLNDILEEELKKEGLTKFE